MEHKQLLIVDDDREIRALLSAFFQKHGFGVTAVADGKGVTKRAIDNADLVLLDLMLPQESGLDICRRLRAQSSVPIIMLTAAAADADRIVGLELGADDYVVKPFNPRELLARVNAVLRRAGPAAPTRRVYGFEGWQIDVPRRLLRARDGVITPLSAAEFDLLAVFVEHAQQVLNRDRLLELARGRSAAVIDRSIDVLVSRLRRKIEADPANPALIKTVRTGGYVLTAAVSPLAPRDRAMNRPRWLRLPNRLAVWLAMTIVVGLVAIQLVNIGLVVLTRPEPTPAIAARWLSDRLIEAAATRDANELAASPAVEDLSPWFTLQWGTQPGWIDALAERGDERGPMPLRMMGRFIEQRLGAGARVEIALAPANFSLTRLLQPFPTAPPPPRTFGRQRDGRDFLVPASVSIALRTGDGRWLVAESRYGWSIQEKAAYFLGYLAAFTLVIGLVAWWAARRLIRPLAQLGAAVGQIGATRQPMKVREAGPEEVRLIARSINDMQQRIKRFVDERMAMAGAMSHDLRTPLTRLRLRAELAEDQELRRKLLADVDELSGIVEDALALARFDEPREPPAIIDLSLLLRGLIDDANDAGQSAEFAGEDGVRIQGHPTALRRAFANLLDNAAKYGGGALVALRREADGAVITIEDRGPGIADADKGRVFEAFERLEASRNRGTGGSGLGLTIARSIIDAHGGSIALSDASPHGLVVGVRLPLAAR